MLVPRLSRGYMSECITQESFGNNKLSHFHIMQRVQVVAEELISVNTKWVSDTFAYPNPSQKPFEYPHS